jgi:hypothetical protein
MYFYALSGVFINRLEPWGPEPQGPEPRAPKHEILTHASKMTCYQYVLKYKLRKKSSKRKGNEYLLTWLFCGV